MILASILAEPFRFSKYGKSGPAFGSVQRITLNSDRKEVRHPPFQTKSLFVTVLTGFDPIP